jgi:hypothetical protein
MSSRHRFPVFTSDGIQIAKINGYISCEYWRVISEIGGFQFIMGPDFDTRNIAFPIDRLIEFWRTPPSGIEQLMMVGFVRWWEWGKTPDGNETFTFGGTDQNGILDRRIIAYNAASAQADKVANGDNMLKAIVRENMGSLAPLDEAGRPRAYDPDYFSCAPDFGHAPSIERRFAWRKVFPTLKEICESSGNLGTPLYFDVVPGAQPAHFEFRTYTNLLGVDRTATTGLNPVVFSEEFGNLAEPKMREDWSEEHDYVYGGGQGEEADRIIDPEDDPWRMHRSIWNRRECFQDAREEDTQIGVANKAYQRMEQDRPKLRFSGKLLDAQQSIFGLHWNYGDKVTARYRYEFDGMINAYRIVLDDDGNEDLTVRLEVDLATG